MFTQLQSLFFFKQKPAYEMRISDWSSDVCSSDLEFLGIEPHHQLSHSRLPIGGIFVADHFTVGMQPRNPAPIGCRQDQFELARFASQHQRYAAEQRDRKSTRLNSSH